MSAEKTGDAAGRYTDICGASNRNDEPCSLPAGWGTPGSGGSRCKFHGGASTGPSDTEHLAENDFAEGNAGGGAPEGNTNAEIHGGFGDWEKAYDRLDEETRAFVDAMISDMRETAKEHAPDVPEERRERLLKEKATLSVMWNRTAADMLGTPEDPVDGARGIVIREEREHNGDTYTVEKANPAWEAGHSLTVRKRKIAEELGLWPGFQE
ncbi:hypothetical protein DM867_13080 [Halosegnis rubeus]|uniref:Uncharacterized protein n=1 Tax=Halosegnis rubeus TaxID=2212850 RepID=A0A5N5U1V9_9EURY|nr:HGGxSTG domain-containing protein [Halosegnis rubeus]KAB7512438.1 hypothetical protein DM867_13080 [Halosegnis rubeus]